MPVIPDIREVDMGSIVFNAILGKMLVRSYLSINKLVMFVISATWQAMGRRITF
jgi:hypothetical protein